MRTTLRIDDDILEVARSLARAEGATVGEVISRLARRGLVPVPEEVTDGGFPVFRVAEGAAPITLEKVADALDE